MLRVVDDFFAVIFEITDRVADHAQIFVRLGAQDFRDVEQPRLADDGDDGGLGFEDQPHQVVLFHGHAFAARHAERGDLRILPFAPRGLLEELHVLRIAARPAAFNVMNPERIELLRNAELVHGREIDAFALRSVAQRRVVDFHWWFH